MKAIMKQWAPMLGLAVLFAGCAGGTAALKDATPVIAAVESDGVQRATIVGKSYAFIPAAVVVKVNIPVELTLRKESGIVPHSFILMAPAAGINISEDLSTKPKVVRFTPTKTGAYSFFCGKKLLFFASHREKGMEGVLEVK